MSLCGSLNNPSGSIAEKFLQHQIAFDDLASNPKIFEEPNLVVRYDGQYYNWKTAAPLIMSLLVFRRPLPQVRKPAGLVDLLRILILFDIVIKHLCFIFF